MYLRLFLALVLSVGIGRSATATWYNENIENGADIIMMDLRWPWWPSGTYYANWNTSFNPKPNNISFYAGFTSTVPEMPGFLPNTDEKVLDAFRPGSVWSFWGADAEGTPVRFIDASSNQFIMNVYGGEGLSGTLGNVGWPFIKNKRWYTMVARVWRPLGEEADSNIAYCGRWIKDHADGRWHGIALAKLPIPATSFTGNSGFIEPLSGEFPARPLHRRNGYYRKDGVWKSSDTVSIDNTQYVVIQALPEDGYEYIAMEYAQKPDLLPRHLEGTPLEGGKKHDIKARQPDAPKWDEHLVRDVKAVNNGRQIAVNWRIPETSSPSFSYKIEVFDNADCSGKPVAVQERRMPNARVALLDVAIPKAWIRLTATDLFDRDADPVTVPAGEIKLPAARKTDPKSPVGLYYELSVKNDKRNRNYFYDVLQNPNEQHYWTDLEEIGDAKLIRKGLAQGLDLGVREDRHEGYALRFQGMLRVPESGLYVFYAKIDGAYRIRLGNSTLLEWDGQHGTTEKARTRSLAAGDHPVEITSLVDMLPATNFSLEWEGPGLPRQSIPTDAFRFSGDGDWPEAIISCKNNGDGTGDVSVKVESHGQNVRKTMLYLDRLLLVEREGDSVDYSGPLPSGPNSFRARILFEDDRTVDSEVAVLSVSGKTIAPPWTVRNVGDAKASFGLWSDGPGGVRFFGNGMHTVTQKISGDFTATCRVADYNGSRGEPVNRRAWVGLSAREHGERLNWDWGRWFHLVQTARDGLRASPDFSDLGAGRISSYRLPDDRPWLRISRNGNIWTAWISTDGKKWELGEYQFMRMREELDVGLFFSALSQETRAHYYASVSDLSVVPEIRTESTPAEPVAASELTGDRLTGVVLSRSNPEIVFVRSTRGLRKTDDGGKTWQSVDGDLSGDELFVRSVAIHPTNPDFVIRAGGRGASGALWKSENGGRSWTKLDFPGNFDGEGPSALCGEVLAFDLRDPRIVYAGCESEGFFRSDDSGTNWNHLGLKDQRITSVVVWPWERYYPAVAAERTQICVTTCPDRWMEFLGRGKSKVRTGETSTRSYISEDGVQSLRIMDERDDTGYYNVVFDKATQSVREMCFGSTHGLQNNSGGYVTLFPPQKNLEWFRPMTGIGATAKGEQKFGRILAQSLVPDRPGRLSCSETWGLDWYWTTIEGAIPKGGPIALAGAADAGDVWWFVYPDGLYRSPDAGRTLEKISITE